MQHDVDPRRFLPTAVRVARAAAATAAILVLHDAAAASLGVFISTVDVPAGDIVSPHDGLRFAPWAIVPLFVGLLLIPLDRSWSVPTRIVGGLLRALTLGWVIPLLLQDLFDWVHPSSPRHPPLWSALSLLTMAALVAAMPWQAILEGRAPTETTSPTPTPK